MTAREQPLAPIAGSSPDRRRAQRVRARARRRAVRRRRAVALLVLAAAGVLIGILSSTGSRANTHPPLRRAVAVSRAATHTTAATRRSAAPHHNAAPGPSPGALPQTHDYPSATTAQFHSLMADLWSGVVHDSLARALPAFFPEGAYVQLKAIADASADWQGRLVRDFGLDINAAHALLGADAAHARLISVNVVASYGHWIYPGGCYNSIGYYEMPNARVVYSEGGVQRSFGIASMISWRGVWYVVHFGSILRGAITGYVDDPVSGPGVSAYSGTC